MNLIHIPATVASTIVLFGSRNLRVADPCNGLQLLEILLALVWAWPASWRERALGLAWMLPLLCLANLVRLYSLVPLLLYRPDDFEMIHQYVWQVVMVGVTLAIGVAWMTRNGNRAVDRPGA
jgi:exosortase/archaeosortase family protein